MNIKKKIMVILAAGIMAVSASPFVLAETPAPNNTESRTTATLQPVEGAATVAPAAGAVQTQQNGQPKEEVKTDKKYLTKGSAAFWFIFTVILNALLSFWIGNRFYRLAKKDNHISAEIRALRKDVEEKFANSVGGFAEQEVDINNLNESLAMDDEGIKATPRQPVMRAVSEEEEERFRRWEEAQSKPKSERVRPSKAKSAVKEELDDDFEDIKRIRRKKYQPKREENADFFDDEDMGETKEIKIKNSDNVRNKAKEILGDIFPFKED